MFELKLPLMGEGVNEATIVKWLKGPGDKIVKDEPLVEVSTDKVDTEVPAPVNGTLARIVAQEGAVVAVQGVMAQIETTDTSGTKSASVSGVAKADSGPESSKRKQAPRVEKQTNPSAPTRSEHDPILSSPLVRKLAQEYGIDLSLVVGTGLNGRITADDIERWRKEGNRGHGSAAPSPNAVQTNVPQKLKTTFSDGIELLDGVPVRREKMSRMRKLIADHMVKTVSIAPHASIFFDVDLGAVIEARDEIKDTFKAKHEFSLSFTPMFMFAVAQAIKEHPYVNVSVDGDEILYREYVNLACAVAIPTGLIVPVVRRASDMSVSQIAMRLQDVVTRARNNQLNPEDVVGGTFTITNHGGWGSVSAMPLINQPQVAILGIGAVIKKPVVVDDKVVVRPIVNLSLTFDHRVIDGEGAAKFMVAVKSRLEQWQPNWISENS